jgi:hypothetical protein
MGLDGSVGEQMMRNRHLEAFIAIYDTETGSHIPRQVGAYAVMRLDSQNVHMGQTQLRQASNRASRQRTHDHTISRAGNLRIDTDGTGPDHGDRQTHANETAYQPHGRSLNADNDPYVAIPTPLLRQGVRLGDRAVLTVNGRSATGVVGDTGADRRFVEASVRLVHDVGVPTRDIPGVGPVPNTLGGREVRATMTLYPSAPPEP